MAEGRQAFGKTARVGLEWGMLQGGLLSPHLCVFIPGLNLCLRHRLDSGVGVGHAARTETGEQVRQNHVVFSDDVVLAAETQGDMNLLLDRVREFSNWSGMELCLLKCKAVERTDMHRAVRDFWATTMQQLQKAVEEGWQPVGRQQDMVPSR